MSLFDQQDLAELSHPDYPGERLIADRNPYLAAERARMRKDLPQATEKLLTAIAGQVSAGRVICSVTSVRAVRTNHSA